MKKLLIILMFWAGSSFGQRLPITGICLSDVLAVTGGTCMSQAFANANPFFFNPAYAIAGSNCLSEFRDYGYRSIISVPTVSVATASAITGTSATSGGYISSDGGASIISRGVCWSTSPNPTLADSYTSSGTGTGSFTSYLTGLSAGTRYYYRAFAQNSVGFAYDGTGYFDTEGECTRPGGLTNYLLVNQYYDEGSDVQLITDQASACAAAQGLIDGVYTWYATPSMQASSIASSEIAYTEHTLTDCSVIADGWYVVSTDGAFSYQGVIEVVDGVMTVYDCESCTRPSYATLATLTVYYAAPDYPSFTTIWEAYGAKYTWCPYNLGTISSMTSQYLYDAGLSVGTTMYSGTGTDCTKLSDGWYFYEDCSVDSNTTWYIQVVSGVIAQIAYGPS